MSEETDIVRRLEETRVGDVIKAVLDSNNWEPGRELIAVKGRARREITALRAERDHYKELLIALIQASDDPEDSLNYVCQLMSLKAHPYRLGKQGGEAGETGTESG